MIVTYVNDRDQKQKNSDDATAYVLPFSGTIMILDIASPFAYVNGDAVKVENGKVSVEIQEKSLAIEADETKYNICVLCSAWSPTLLLDYNSFGRTVENNSIDDGMDQEILFSAIEDEDSEELHISLCTFSRSYENIISREFDIDKALDYTQRLPHVFYKPKQHLKQVNEIRPAAVASRIGQESIRYLASHSEHWKGIKARDDVISGARVNKSINSSKRRNVPRKKKTVAYFNVNAGCMPQKPKSVIKVNTGKRCMRCGEACWRSDVNYCWDCYKYEKFESR